MSHFSVMVIGPNIEQQLAPYHEFECTGTDDQYVQDIDETAEQLEAFKEATKTKVRCPDGTLVDYMDDRFFRDPTPEEVQYLGPLAGSGFGNGMRWVSKDWGDGLGHRVKVHEIPDDHEKVEVKYESFREYLLRYDEIAEASPGSPLDLEGKHKYSYFIFNQETQQVEKVVRRTNPNAKWDWYVIGGRWSGFLRLKPGATGKHGERSWTNSDEPIDLQYCDQARKGDIDFDAMRQDAINDAADQWDRAARARVDAGLDASEQWEAWPSVRDRFKDSDVAREFYHGQPAKKAVSAAFDNPFFDIDQFLMSRDEYIERARSKAISTYAVVKDSQWSERGRMGWFGVSLDEVDEAEWLRGINEMIDQLPDDTLITIVDCHI